MCDLCTSSKPFAWSKRILTAMYLISRDVPFTKLDACNYWLFLKFTVNLSLSNSPGFPRRGTNIRWAPSSFQSDLQWQTNLLSCPWKGKDSERHADNHRWFIRSCEDVVAQMADDENPQAEFIWKHPPSSNCLVPYWYVYVFLMSPIFKWYYIVLSLSCLVFMKPRYVSHLDWMHSPRRWCVLFSFWWRNGWWIELDNRMCISVKLLKIQVC